MIVTRSPLRISLGGGGTDVPSYYEKREGFCISAAINKYVYIIIHKTFDGKLLLKYSQTESVDKVEDVKHPIIREALKFVGNTPNLEITSMSDAPAGTGLGSSGSFTTALLKALYLERYGGVTTELGAAKVACDIEINKLGYPVGKQDQFISSHGGVKCMSFLKDGDVLLKPLAISHDALYGLENNLLLFFTGYEFPASSVLKDQVDRSIANDMEMMNNLDNIKLIGKMSKSALESGNLRRFAKLMDEHWNLKRARSDGMSNKLIDEWYSEAMNNGALGGKLIGAGGRGFLMFYTEKHEKLRRAMYRIGLPELEFTFTDKGTEIVTWR